MRVLKINDSKVKIMLTKRDMIAFGMDGAPMNMCEGDTRTKIYRVLDEVKAKHGFDHGGAKLVVQIYPSADGGAEIFVYFAVKNKRIRRDINLNAVFVRKLYSNF